MANTSGSARDYCFTLFVNEDEQKLALWCCPEEAFDATHPDLKYAIWQIEKAPTTGALHVQGFLMLRKQMGRKRVQEVGDGMHAMHAMPMLTCTPHAELSRTRRGTPGEAARHCR